MWRLLPNALCNKAALYFSPRRLFLLQIIGFVFSVHMAFVLIAFFMGWWYNGKNNFTISLHEQAATYVLMPLHKTVDTKKNKQASSVESHKKSNIINYDAYMNKKNARKKNRSVRLSTKKNQVNQKATSVKSMQGKKTSKKQASVAPIASIASMVLQAPKAEKLPKGKKKKSSKIKMQTLPEQLASKQAKSEQVQQDQTIVKQVIVQQATPEQATPEQATPEQVTPEQVTPEQVAPEQAVSLLDSELKKELDAVNAITSQEDEDIDLDNVVFIGNQDLDERLLGQKVQQLVVQNWTPPAGMTSGKSCKIRVKVDSHGQGIDAQVVKGSGVFMYDRSLRQATMVEGYPKELCGKTISFTFEE